MSTPFQKNCQIAMCIIQKSALNIQLPIFFQSFRTFTGIGFSFWVKLWLRKEKSFSPGKRLAFPENDKGESLL